MSLYEDEESNLTFSDLINEDFPAMLFSDLTMENLLKLRLISTEMKNSVDLYIKKKRPPILRLPPGIRYNRATIATIAENINEACAVFNKHPQECTMSIVCRIFYNKTNTLVTSDPPLPALTQIGRTGVKISLRLFFDVGSLENYGETWLSYNHTLAEVLIRLPFISTLDIDFSSHQIPLPYFNRGNWFDRTAIILGGLQHISSLSISGIAPWQLIFQSCMNLPSLTQLNSIELYSDLPCLLGTELVEFMEQMTNLKDLSIGNFKNVPADQLITCLSSMTELTSFSINGVSIINSNSNEFGDDLCTALPKLLNLRLCNSWIEFENIWEIIPNIIPLLQNLTTLDLSNNSIDLNVILNIADALEGNMPNLTSLNLSYNSIGEKTDGVNPYCIGALLPTLISLGNLVELNLSDNDIDPYGVNLLIPVFKKLHSLAFLNMSGNKLTYKSINLLRRTFRRFKEINVIENYPDVEDEGDEGDEGDMEGLD
jgi:hypothetical protein